VTAQPQVEVVGTTLTVGPKPTTPSGSSVRLDGLATTGGTGVLLATSSGDVVKRTLVRGDLPAGIAFLDVANVFSQLNTFNAGISASSAGIVGALNVGGNSTLTGTLSVGSTTTLGANLVFSGSGRRILGDGLIVQASTANAATGLSVLPNGTSTDSHVITWNRSDMTGTGYMQMGVNATRGFLSPGSLPLWIYALAQPRIQLDAGHSLLTDTGTSTSWEFAATGNTSGQRVWRAGNVAGQFRIDAGDDAATTWTNLLRSSSTSGTADGIFLGTGVREVSPDRGYQTNLGRLTSKYLALHAAELWVETLVQQDTLATVGGRVLIGPTSVFARDAAAGDVYITLKHSFPAGSILYAEAGGQVEFMQVNANYGACNAAGGILCPGVADGAGFAYYVSRNLDPSPSNAWSAGDAVFHTGTTATGEGWIDLYSVRSMKRYTTDQLPVTELGPTIVGNVRTGTAYNAWAPRWALGNLSGLYWNGSTSVYGSAFGDPNDVWISTDATNGFRVMDGQSSQKMRVYTDGTILVGEQGAGQYNTIIQQGQIQLRSGTVPRIALNNSGMSMHNADGVQRMLLTPVGLQFFDAGGVNYGFDFNMSTTYELQLGYRHLGSTYPNVSISSSTGEILVASGHSTRIKLSAGNGDLTMYDNVGQRMVWLTPQSGGVMEIGRSGVTGAAVLHFNAGTNNLSMCSYNGPCTLTLLGASGDISSTGNIYLSGGAIRSTGNFVLGDSQGMAFEQWAGTSYVSNRSLKFTRNTVATAWLGQDTSGALRIRSATIGGGTGIRLTLGDDNPNPYNEAGIFMTREVNPNVEVVTNVVIQNIPYGGATNTRIQVVPIHYSSTGATSTLGTAEYRWSAVYADQYYAISTPGYTGYMYFRNRANTGECYVYFHGGLTLFGTCS
jgi:hypothetical protein